MKERLKLEGFSDDRECMRLKTFWSLVCTFNKEMNVERAKAQKQDYSQVISDYVRSAKGLDLHGLNGEKIDILQKEDTRVLSVVFENIKEVLFRYNEEYKNFLQINFKNGKKVLLTDRLIGFPPKSSLDAEGIKLPQVVSTLDMLSFFDMTEEYLQSESCSVSELVALKRVCDLILESAMDVGFDVSSDRTWFHQISYSLNKASF